MSWAILCAFAGILGLLTERKRDVDLRLVGVFVLVIFLRQAVFYLKDVIWLEWTVSWGTVAALSDMACFLAITTWGMKSVVENSPDVSLFLPVSLFSILSASLIAGIIQMKTGHSLWGQSANIGGLFKNGSVWSAFSAVSFPVLLSAGGWLYAPALIVLVWCKNSSSLLALFLSVIISKKMSLKLILPLLIPVFIVLILAEGRMALFNLRTKVRVQTWYTVTKAIIKNPDGIGWMPFSYQKAMNEATHERHSTLPHSSSDVLHSILRVGWIMVPVLFAAFLWVFKTFSFYGYDSSLLTASILSFIQTSVLIPQVGFLVFLILCAHLIERSGNA